MVVDRIRNGPPGSSPTAPIARRRRARRAPALLDYVASWGYISAVKRVGLRELKNRLSEYVRQVRSGHGVLVTDRGIDALHLASVLVASTALKDLVLLSVDRRVCAAARQLGLRLAPA